MIDLLYKSQSLNKKYSSYLTKILVKKHPFYKTMERYTLYIKKFFENYTDVNNFIKKSQIEIGEALQDLRYNGFFQNIRDASEYNYTENRYYKLILHQHSTLKEVLDSVLDEYINYQLTHDLTDYLNKYLNNCYYG